MKYGGPNMQHCVTVSDEWKERMKHYAGSVY